MDKDLSIFSELLRTFQNLYLNRRERGDQSGSGPRHDGGRGFESDGDDEHRGCAGNGGASPTRGAGSRCSDE